MNSFLLIYLVFFSIIFLQAAILRILLLLFQTFHVKNLAFFFLFTQNRDIFNQSDVGFFFNFRDLRAAPPPRSLAPPSVRNSGHPSRFWCSRFEAFWNWWFWKKLKKLFDNFNFWHASDISYVRLFLTISKPFWNGVIALFANFSILTKNNGSK